MSGNRRTGVVATLWLFVAVSFAMVWLSAGWLREDIQLSRALTELSFWQSPTYRPDSTIIAETGATLSNLIRGAYADPDALQAAANFESWRVYRTEAATTSTASREELTRSASDAVTLQATALHLRPGHLKAASDLQIYVKTAKRITGYDPAVIESATLQLNQTTAGMFARHNASNE